MAGVLPFLGNTPLTSAPYYSRVASTSLVDSIDNRNYPLIAFKPGYALQASELNEIQDNFYVQKTLSDNLFQNWWKTGTNLSLTGVVNEIMYGPGWEGAIPLNPSGVSIGAAGSLRNFSFTKPREWFLITEPATKFKFWIVVDTSTVGNLGFVNVNLPAITYFGIKINSSFVGCSSSSADPGFIFNDNSSGNYIENTCGASRYNIELNTFALQTTITTDFLPIARIKKNADAGSADVVLIQYMNNHLISKTSI